MRESWTSIHDGIRQQQVLLLMFSQGLFTLIPFGRWAYSVRALVYETPTVRLYVMAHSIDYNGLCKFAAVIYAIACAYTWSHSRAGHVSINPIVEMRWRWIAPCWTNGPLSPYSIDARARLRFIERFGYVESSFIWQKLCRNPRIWTKVVCRLHSRSTHCRYASAWGGEGGEQNCSFAWIRWQTWLIDVLSYRNASFIFPYSSLWIRSEFNRHQNFRFPFARSLSLSLPLSLSLSLSLSPSSSSESFRNYIQLYNRWIACRILLRSLSVLSVATFFAASEYLDGE